jgi:hypothetical protein
VKGAARGPCSEHADKIVPGLGVCAHDVRHAASAMLAGMGVNLLSDDGQPSPVTVLEAGIMNELQTLDLVIGVLEKRNETDPAVHVLHAIRERLEALSEAGSFLAQLHASGAEGGAS